MGIEQMNNDLEQARAIIARIAPTHNPETSCMLVASAIAGIRRLTMRHIKIGALFWPEKFKDEPALSMRGGWGCEGYDQRTGTLYLSDDHVDPDEGSFGGHTWLEPEKDVVLDPQHGFVGDHIARDKNWNVTMRYIRRPPLERSVKAFWRTHMMAAIKAGKELATQ